VKERPILFNAAMVRALLEGRKTQTRRVVKDGMASGYSIDFQKTQAFQDKHAPYCPYGQPGDRIWVRETWRTDATLDSKAPRTFCGWPVKYEADSMVLRHGAHFGKTDGKTRVSIHMPRWASRILLEIVNVRVERLRDISEAAVLAEGVKRDSAGGHFIDGTDVRYAAAVGAPASDAFSALWDGINGAGSWEANPWVWVVEFKRVLP
jgi:hypothetical protein